jgi:gas vesicle protein
METREHNYSGVCKGFLIGSFFGAAAAILFAPKAGKELRSDIKESGEKALKDTKQFYSDAKAKAEAVYENARHRMMGDNGEMAEGWRFQRIESPEERIGEA